MASGVALFNGQVIAAGTTGISTSASASTSNFWAAGGAVTYSSSLNTAGLLFDGASNVNTRAVFNGITSSTLNTGNNYGNVIVGSVPITTATSGTHAMLANFVVNALGTVTSGGATVTNTASLYVDGAGSGGTANYALYVNGGISQFNGEIESATASTGIAYQSSTTTLTSDFTTLGNGSNTATTAGLLFGGASTINYRTITNGASSTTLGTGNSYGSFIVGSAPITTATSGTHAVIANFVINPVGTVTAGGAAITNTASLYINGASSAGTSNYALDIVSGNSLFGGAIIGGVGSNSTAFQSSSTVFSSNFMTLASGSNTTNTAGLLFDGASNVNYRTFTNGQTSSTLTTNNSYGSFIVGSAPITTATSGTHAMLANFVVDPIGTVTAGGATISNTASLYIDSASTAGTNNYGLYVNTNSAMTTGTASAIASSATGITTAGSNIGSLFDITESGNMTALTGSLASIDASGTNTVGNTGNLLNLNVAGTAQIMKALNLTDATTGALTNGIVRLNFTGAHTGNGLEIDDATATGNAVAITTSALTSGNALSVTAALASNTNVASFSSGQTSTSASTILNLQFSGLTNVGTANNFIKFLNGASSPQGVITGTGTAGAVLYTTTSDQRVKHDITETHLGLSDLLNINVDDFVFNSDTNNTVQTGFVAQQLDTIFPEAVATNGDNGTVPLTPGEDPWSVDYGRVTPLIVKAVQDQQALLGTFTLSTGDNSNLISDTQNENPQDAISIIQSKITAGTQFLTDFVSLRVTAIRGYFDEVFANKVHSNQICLKKSDGTEICIDGDQLQNIMSNNGGGGTIVSAPAPSAPAPTQPSQDATAGTAQTSESSDTGNSTDTQSADTPAPTVTPPDTTDQTTDAPAPTPDPTTDTSGQ